MPKEDKKPVDAEKELEALKAAKKADMVVK